MITCIKSRSLISALLRSWIYLLGHKAMHPCHPASPLSLPTPHPRFKEMCSHFQLCLIKTLKVSYSLLTNVLVLFEFFFFFCCTNSTLLVLGEIVLYAVPPELKQIHPRPCIQRWHIIRVCSGFRPFMLI